MNNNFEMTLDLTDCFEYDLLFKLAADIEQSAIEDAIHIRKGTRHPSTRGERRKKTAHAKQRKAEVIRTREARKLPYSQMLGKGKKHEHIWLDESAIVETRQEEKWKSEVRDLWRWIRNEREEKEETERSYWDYYEDYYYNKLLEAREEISDKADYIRFLESRIADLEREIGF